MIILEEKQVGPVSYMVRTPDVLFNIVSGNKILRSKKPEYNPKTKKNQYYVSLSRNLTAAAERNSERWSYGVVLDGTKLSNRYNIEPVSYVGQTTIRSAVSVKTLTAYDNDTYYVTFVRFPSIKISRTTYDKLKTAILNLPEDTKELKKLVYQSGGKRAVRGAKIAEKFNFNVPTGGLRITTKEYPELVGVLSKDPGINEYEERIWLNNSKLFINISGCIEKVLIPRRDKNSSDEDIIELIDFCDSNNLEIVYY